MARGGVCESLKRISKRFQNHNQNMVPLASASTVPSLMHTRARGAVGSNWLERHCLVPSFALDLSSPSSVPKIRPPKVSFDLAFHFSRIMQRLFSPLLLLLLVAPCCLSWGPFSHVQFGSDALPSPPPSQQQLSSFFAGCVSPDAIKSVNLSLHSLRKRLMYSFCSKALDVFLLLKKR